MDEVEGVRHLREALGTPTVCADTVISCSWRMAQVRTANSRASKRSKRKGLMGNLSPRYMVRSKTVAVKTIAGFLNWGLISMGNGSTATPISQSKK